MTCDFMNQFQLATGIAVMQSSRIGMHAGAYPAATHVTRLVMISAYTAIDYYHMWSLITSVSTIREYSSLLRRIALSHLIVSKPIDVAR